MQAAKKVDEPFYKLQGERQVRNTYGTTGI